MSDIIAGLTAGTTAITVADNGSGVCLKLESRALGSVEAVLSVNQSQRLRRLLSASEKRAQEVL